MPYMTPADRLTRADRLPPLENGDHLDQKTFHARYEAMPPHVRAELIGGIVYMSSPQRVEHGTTDSLVTHWVGTYVEATPGTECLANTASILADDSEPQPDSCLIILPEYGGQTRIDKGYLSGAPEWIGEISWSSESIDLNAKMSDYEKAGVREYMVVALRLEQVLWFVRRRGKFKPLSPSADGLLRSTVFPGLWLDPAALLKRDRRGLLGALRQGLASPEHGRFVARLQGKHDPSH